MKKLFTQLTFSLVLAVLLGIQPAMAQPSNDDCANAITLVCGAGLTAGTTVGCVPPDDPIGCASDYGVWYTFVGDGSEITISSPTTFDHELDLFTASAGCGSSYTPIICRDLSTGTETYTFTSVDGTTYYLYIAHYSTSSSITGTFDVEITCFMPTPPPANDVCSGAFDYDTSFGAVGAAGSCPGNVTSLDISNYEDNGVDPTCDAGGDATAWYTWTANATSVTFNAISGAPGLEILSGSCGSLVSEGCLNNTSGTIDGLTIGASYYMIIWDDGVLGTTLQWCLEATPPPPANDACAGAIAIVSGGAAGGSLALANDLEGLSSCSSTTGSGTICDPDTGDGGIDWGPGVWYVYTSNGAENIEVDLTGSDFDSEVQIFSGSCGSLSCVGGDDDSGLGTTSKICFESTASFAPVDYYIYIDGHAGNIGNYAIQVNAVPLPVELISFEGEKLDKVNKLTWVTGSEANTEAHFVERSVDGNRWEVIGKRDAQGFSSSQQSYEFIDPTPFAKSFYRLKSVDFDGSINLSEVIRLERERDGFSISKVFPIPASDEITVEFNVDRNEEINLVLTDFVGRVVYRETRAADNGINNFQLKVADLADGIYFLSLNNATEQLTQRIIKN